MGDFENLWTLISNFLQIRFTLYGFSITWGNVLMYSLLGSLIIGCLMHIFKSHE